ncbi:hypothetical protein PVAND_008050 [Polypedilum vanderplanki]|uniref:ZAD domain-containing protein n=1 Tax=Polypedilum vanderplanki TaxID=319348 RepID=A0A9J6C913_POLVA|nr:hypothetical protein PVAND_008050 [Polypedilum vanderplanki]
MATAISDKTKEECRLCGRLTPVTNIRKKLKEKIKGFVSFKEFIEYFCRITLIDNENLPDGVCQKCYQTLVDFCILSVTAEKNQANYEKQPVMNSHKRKRDDSNLKDSFNDSASTNEDGEKSSSSRQKKQNIKLTHSKPTEDLRMTTDDNNSNSSCSNSSNSRSIGNVVSSKFRSESNIKGCFNDVFKLFKDELVENEKSYEKITIKEGLLLDGGEIPKKWLSRYSNFVTWEMKHYCSHCNKNFDSLGALLLHFNEFKIPSNKRSIKCAACDLVFNESRCIASYINHMDKQHYNHLKFACIWCEKVFYNVVRLCEHGIKYHGELNFKYYPCFDCGLICPTFDQIVQHKTCHDV